MSDKPVVPVFFTIDQTYLPWLTVALESMKENADKSYLVRAHVVHQDLEEDDIRHLEAMNDESFEVVCSKMPHSLDEITNWAGNYLRADYFTLTIFFRIFLPDLFEQYDKAIYLDSDIVVPGDITELYRTDLQGNYMGVVNDYSIAGIPPLVDYVENFVGVDHTRYFNSGILLMDFKVLREKQLGQRFLEILNRENFDTIAPDQDYLNFLCKDKVLQLPRTWDSMPCELPEFEDPQIIHYNLFDKPWCYDNIKYEDYFWKYARKTDCYEEIKAFKEAYSEDQKAADTQSKELLVSKGGHQAHIARTMKSTYESGEESRL